MLFFSVFLAKELILGFFFSFHKISNFTSPSRSHPLFLILFLGLNQFVSEDDIDITVLSPEEKRKRYEGWGWSKGFNH